MDAKKVIERSGETNPNVGRRQVNYLTAEQLAALSRIAKETNAALLTNNRALREAVETVFKFNSHYSNTVKETAGRLAGIHAQSNLTNNILREYVVSSFSGEAFAAKLLDNPGLASVRESIVRISSMSLVAEETLGRIFENYKLVNNEPFGRFRKDLLSSFVDYSQIYKLYSESMLETGDLAIANSPAIVEIPANEYFTSVELLDSTISKDSPEQNTKERDEKRNEVWAPNRVNAIELLSGVDESWVRMLEGASYAINSKSPDKVRQSMVSVRELMTQVLHHLSPDKLVREWTKAEHHFYNGNPTRNARLEFILRDLNDPNISAFLKADVKTTLEFFALLQKATHSSDPPLSELQANALIAKAHGLIVFLFSVAREAAK